MASHMSGQAGAANVAISVSPTTSSSTNASGKRPRTNDGPESERMARTSRPRVRVTLACTECRKRKDRCDGRRPICLPCHQAGRPCNYDSFKKRGLRPGYVRALEVMLSLVFSTIHGSEEWLSDLFEGRKVATPEFSLTREKGLWARDGVEALLDDWRKKRLLSQIDLILAQADVPDSSGENEQSSETSSTFDRRVLRAVEEASRVVTQQGTATDEDDRQMFLPPSPMMTDSTATALPHSDSRFLNAGNTPSRSNPTVTGPDAAVIQQTFCSSDPHTGAISQVFQSRSHAETAPFLPDNWSSLLDIYFSNYHCWLPISPKHDLLRCAHVLACHTGPSTTPDSLSRGDLAFLAAVLAYVGHGPEIAVIHPTRTPADSSQCPPPALLGKMMALISEDEEYVDLGIIRAFIILALIRMQQNNRKAAWVAIGRAIYGLTSLQAGQVPHDAGQQTSIDDGYRRTSLCCIALDSVVASWLGIRPYFKRSDISQVGPLSTESMEEWETWHPKASLGSICNLPFQAPPSRILSTFNHFVELVGILNELSWAVDPQEGQLRHLERLLDDFTKRLDSQYLDASLMSSVIPPQVLNLRFLSATVREAIRTREISITGTYLGLGVTDVCRPLQNLGVLVQKQVSLLGSQSVLPTHAMYLYTIDLSLERQLHLPCSLPGYADKLGALRNSFAEIGWFCRNEPTSRKDSSDVVAGESGCQPLHGAQRMQETRSMDNSHECRSPSAPQVQPTDGMDFGSLMDVSAIPSELNEDALFHSLADLDSADWSANPPDFMKHLGVMSDLPPDLAVALFDESND